jgi:hypothetical protein
MAKLASCSTAGRPPNTSASALPETLTLAERVLARLCIIAVLAVLGLGAWAPPTQADTHIYAGALGTNQNDRLFFSNGVLFDATATNYSLPQILRTNGLNAGYFRGDVLTFSALAGTVPNGGPIPGHAAFGSRLAVQVVSVEGPPGGSFAFWEGDGESDLGEDPYGHIHGREFTTSAPGTYIVGFRVIDVSTNGAGGGPIHSPSNVLPLRFQAGLRIEAIQTFTNRATIAFRSPPGISNVLEKADTFVSPTWQAAAASLRGNNNLQTLTDTNPPAVSRFYRLRQLNNLP